MKLAYVFMVAILPSLAWPQGVRSCCSPLSEASVRSGPEEMAMFANDPSFRRTHESPLPSRFSPTSGRFVTFKTPDGTDGRAFQVRPQESSNNVVLMFHEWWGLNEYIQQEAERLQSELGDATVLALDLYDGKVTTSPEEAGKLTQSVSTERAGDIIEGALAFVGPDARIATIGWCFGGGWSHQAALIAGQQSVACVIYYGTPETDVSRLRTLNAPVLGIFARQDSWITPERVKKFEEAMKKAGKQLTVKIYDAAHAFANPSNPKHNKKATADAWKHTITFLKKNL